MMTSIDGVNRSLESIGFNPSDYEGYLWTPNEKEVWMMGVIPRKEKTLSDLFSAIKKAGKEPVVPDPVEEIQGALMACGFSPDVEWVTEMKAMSVVWRERS